MSGHSKWSGIKHKKAIVDAQRGKLFSKFIREITMAAKLGGGDPNSNPRLRLAIARAKEVNLPKDSLERAIKRGTGDLPGVSYEEMIMEGYGPGGAAILVEALTDNKNRTTAELRKIFDRNQGSSAGAGSVSWLFQKKGMIILSAKGVDEDKLLETVLEAGAEDLKVDGDQAIVYTSLQTLEAVKQALEKAGLRWESADLTMISSSTTPISNSAQAKALLRLMDALEDHDDSQKVHSNFDIPDSVLAEYGGSS